MIDTKLITFLKLCETKNYTKTAEELFITQPAVTHHIKMLEKNYDIELFVASNKKFELTAQGQLLYQYAKRSLDFDNQFEKALESTKSTLSTLSIGITPSVMNTYFQVVFEKLTQLNNNIKFNLSIEKQDTINEKLISGDIDLALTDASYMKVTYDHSQLTTENIIVVCGKRNPILKKNNIELDKLVDEKWYLLNKGNAIRDILALELRKNNINLDKLKMVVDINDEATIKRLIKTTNGIGVFYESYVKMDLLKGDLVKIDLPQWNLHRDFSIIYLKNHLQKAKLRHMADEIIKIKESL